jgi:hypothetical protein
LKCSILLLLYWFRGSGFLDWNSLIAAEWNHEAGASGMVNSQAGELVRELRKLSLRGVFCRSLFFRLAITPDKTAEIASSQKTLLAMTVISSSRTASGAWELDKLKNSRKDAKAQKK